MKKKALADGTVVIKTLTGDITNKSFIYLNIKATLTNSPTLKGNNAVSKASSKKERKQEDKKELVLTPGGWRPKSKVHKVEPGQYVSIREGHAKIIETATGKVIKDLGEPSEAESAQTEKRRVDEKMKKGNIDQKRE